MPHQTKGKLTVQCAVQEVYVLTVFSCTRPCINAIYMCKKRLSVICRLRQIVYMKMFLMANVACHVPTPLMQHINFGAYILQTVLWCRQSQHIILTLLFR